MVRTVMQQKNNKGKRTELYITTHVAVTATYYLAYEMHKTNLVEEDFVFLPMTCVDTLVDKH